MQFSIGFRYVVSIDNLTFAVYLCTFIRIGAACPTDYWNNDLVTVRRWNQIQRVLWKPVLSGHPVLSSLRTKRFRKHFPSVREAFFAFWPRENWGEGVSFSLPLPLHVPLCARPNLRAAKKRKMPRTCGKPYGNACYAGYSLNGYKTISQWCPFNSGLTVTPFLVLFILTEREVPHPSSAPLSWTSLKNETRTFEFARESE